MTAADAQQTRVLALSGGVGGAKMAQALLELMPDPQRLCVVGNTGDDFEHLGLYISPDLDSVMYRLADLHDEARGWGRRDETWHCLKALNQLGGPQWFQLGDQDLATHIERTQRISRGETLSQATAVMCSALAIPCSVVPMSDQPVRTYLHTDIGELEFQHYFVKERCRPRVESFSFRGIERANVSPGFSAALQSPSLDCVVLCPSNPYVSMDPILGLADVETQLTERIRQGVRSVAISPIIGGEALKGPAAKMMTELGLEPTALNVARHYAERGLISHMLIDPKDGSQALQIEKLGVEVLLEPALLNVPEARRRVALRVLG